MDLQVFFGSRWDQTMMEGPCLISVYKFLTTSLCINYFWTICPKSNNFLINFKYFFWTRLSESLNNWSKLLVFLDQDPFRTLFLMKHVCVWNTVFFLNYTIISQITWTSLRQELSIFLKLVYVQTLPLTSHYMNHNVFLEH